jgi:hypothetical protein
MTGTPNPNDLPAVLEQLQQAEPDLLRLTDKQQQRLESCSLTTRKSRCMRPGASTSA